MVIGIVDDKKDDLEIYSSILDKTIKGDNEIHCFTHPEDVKVRLDELDVVFMDVQMPEQDGISLAKELLEAKKSLILVFLSDYDSYVWDSFVVDAIYYMRKRYFEIELPQVIEQIERRISEKQKQYINLEEGQKLHHLSVVDIIYVEAQKKYVNIRMSNGDIQIKYQINMLEKKLADQSFIKTHRSYLVNPLYIKSLKEREMVLENDEVVPVSKYRTEEVKNEYLTYLNKLI